MKRKLSFVWLAVFVAGLALFADFSETLAGGKLGIYGTRMVPYGDDAKDYSRAGWGGGLHAVLPVPQLGNMFAGVAGLEVINLLSKTVTFQDYLTGLRVEQQTDQNYFRFFLGSQVGGHGNGFIRPHAGLNLALAFYNFSFDVVVPNDLNRQNEIRQNLRNETKAVFGYDLNFGLDLNFSNSVAVDGGARYLKSFSVPQQLGAGSTKIYPQYFQIYFGVGVGFKMFHKR